MYRIFDRRDRGKQSPEKRSSIWDGRIFVILPETLLRWSPRYDVGHAIRVEGKLSCAEIHIRVENTRHGMIRPCSTCITI